MIIRPLTIMTPRPTPVPPGPIVTTLSVTTEPNYNQYCWIVPVDVLLACKTNGLNFAITAYTTVTGTGKWQSASDDARIFILRTNFTGEYTLVGTQFNGGIVPFVPIDSNGYRGMNITNQDLQDASLTTLQSWKDNYGDTTVLMHAPAMQANRFVSEPTCVMTYNP